VGLIGVDYFRDVVAVQLGVSSTPTDAVIPLVGRFTRLEEFIAIGSSLSDTGLAHLKGLTDLNVLVGHGVMRLVAGPAREDRLARRPWESA
jgi:hypothetical protein